MRTIVFLVGRPGSGKSTAARHIAQRLAAYNQPTTHINDYDILRAMFLADTDQRLFRATEGGGFDAKDLSVLDEALQEVEQQARNDREQSGKGLITIEFARDDYQGTFGLFSADFLARAHVLYIHADLELCLQRVHQRVARRTCSDDHPSFSDELFRYHYAKESVSYIRSQLNRDYSLGQVTVIKNTSSLDAFLRKVEQFILPLCAITSTVQSTPVLSGH